MQFRLVLVFKARAKVQVVSRRPLIAEDRVRSQSSPCEMYGGQSNIATGFSSGTSLFPPVSIILLLLHIHLLLRVALTGRMSGRNLGTLQKAIIFRKFFSIRKVIPLFMYLLRSVCLVIYRLKPCYRQV